MGYEPVTYCANCREASDVYMPGFWLCEGCAEEEKEIKTDFWPKPIPLRQFDWSAIDANYDPGDPIGYGRTEQEAIDDLKQQGE